MLVLHEYYFKWTDTFFIVIFHLISCAEQSTCLQENYVLTDYVLTYDNIFFKEYDLKTLISIAIYSFFSSRLIMCSWQGDDWWDGEHKTRIKETS